MRLDLDELPIIWMRDHDEGEVHDDEEDNRRFIAVLRRGEPFVMIAERAPSLPDFAKVDAEERRRRAKLFKDHRRDLARLCRGMILVGRAANLPMPIRKGIEAISSAAGISLLFAESEQAALDLARARLADR